MKPYLSDPDVTIYQGDCLDVLRELSDASVDAVITDPPYGIAFMGKAWDGKAIEAQVARREGLGPSEFRRTSGRSTVGFGVAAEAGAYDFSPKGNRAFQAWCEQWGLECLRVLKPGGHLLSFGGTRTYHRLTAGLEDAGFEIRDCLAWLYGSGFPKSLDVSKAIDKAAGAERKLGAVKVSPDGTRAHGRGWAADPRPWQADPNAADAMNRESLPATPDAERWQGWGTALKPAFEPIVLARKPLIGTVAGNVLEHGTGAINVDGCRVSASEDCARTPSLVAETAAPFGRGLKMGGAGNDLGRWPANVLLDEEAAAMLDEQTSHLHSAGFPQEPQEKWRRDEYAGVTGWGGNKPCGARIGDSGGASRFFYVAKASRAERNAGLESFPSARSADEEYGTIQQPKLDRATPRENWTPHKTANVHPTVKPIALMRWLVRLVSPPAGLVLDPFLGSGTTGIAASLEGFRFIGIEREDDYLPIAAARIRFWQEHGEDGLRIVAIRDRAERIREEIAEAGQLSLLSEAS